MQKNLCLLDNFRARNVSSTLKKNLWTKTKGLARVTPSERERERERERQRCTKEKKQAPTQMILGKEKEIEKVPRWSRSRPKMAGRYWNAYGPGP